MQLDLHTLHCELFALLQNLFTNRILILNIFDLVEGRVAFISLDIGYNMLLFLPIGVVRRMGKNISIGFVLIVQFS